MIAAVLGENKQKLLDGRYSVMGPILGKVNAQLKWGDGKYIKSSFDAAILALLGPRDERDTKKKKQPKEKKEKKKEEKKEEKKADEEPDDFHKSGREIPEAENTPEQLAGHKATRPANLVTRFPPEPNGYLHLGHGKAMNFNFGIAKKHAGFCYMRFDDTNPTAEKQIYIDSILGSLDFLGHVPSKVTYTSDYFPRLHELAVQMITDGFAYVCHQTKAEIEVSRSHQPCIPSPYRERSIAENLKLFEDMRKGKFAEGEAILRMKGDLASPNPQMWDIIAYRIMYHRHPMSGDKWCIYPSYDYAHCIVDSLENITHSLCTLEFEARRESYFWLLHVLRLYKPCVWEYSRLEIEGNVLSKRKLIALVNEGYVRGWDDCRLLTISGLQRRGFSADALNNFCEGVGVTRNANSIPWHIVEHHVRADLEPRVARAYCCVNPLKITITNYNEVGEFKKQKEIANHPSDASFGSRTLDFTQVVYIDRSDFRLVDEKGYFGLAPGKTVHLKFAHQVTCVGHTLDADGEVLELQCTMDAENKAKVKGKLHWVPENALSVEVRLYNNLFTVPNPGKNENVDWRTEINTESEIVVKSLIDSSVTGAQPGTCFQFERVGYFVVDKDSTADHMVFNRSCGLKLKASNAKKKF